MSKLKIGDSVFVKEGSVSSELYRMLHGEHHNKLHTVTYIYSGNVELDNAFWTIRDEIAPQNSIEYWLQRRLTCTKRET